MSDNEDTPQNSDDDEVVVFEDDAQEAISNLKTASNTETITESNNEFNNCFYRNSYF